MHPTKQHILQTACDLFNQQGLDATSTHDIAKAAGIRQGNLTYHFPQRAQLVEALYQTFISELDGLMGRLSPQTLSLELLYSLQVGQAELQLKYRFLFIEFAAIKRRFPAVEAHFAQLLTQREIAFGHLIAGFQHLGLLQTDLSAEAQQRLYQHFVLIGNFWPHAAEVLPPPSGKLTNHYAYLTLSLLYPYLTEAGRQAWQALPVK